MSQIDKVLNNCKKYLGVKEGSSQHIHILNVYNNHRPLARGYTVKPSDAWCMTFISAMFIETSAVAALGLTECGCQEYVNYARKHNMIVSEPTVGDLAFYDWGGDGVADHVGIIYYRAGNVCNVYEGNKNDSVAVRSIGIKDSRIKCFVRPKYAGPADEYDVNRLSFADSFDGKLAGKYKCKASDFAALRYNPYVTDNNMIDEIQPGEYVQNYGYYSNGWLLVVYKGKTGFTNILHFKKEGK